MYSLQLSKISVVSFDVSSGKKDTQRHVLLVSQLFSIICMHLFGMGKSAHYLEWHLLAKAHTL